MSLNRPITPVTSDSLPRGTEVQITSKIKLIRRISAHTKDELEAKARQFVAQVSLERVDQRSDRETQYIYLQPLKTPVPQKRQIAEAGDNKSGTFSKKTKVDIDKTVSEDDFGGAELKAPKLEDGVNTDEWSCFVKVQLFEKRKPTESSKGNCKSLRVFVFE